MSAPMTSDNDEATVPNRKTRRKLAAKTARLTRERKRVLAQVIRRLGKKAKGK